MLDVQMDEALKRQLDDFIQLLIQYPSMKAVALSMKVSERTAYKWLKIPYVRNAYEEYKKAQFQESMDTLKRLASKSIEVLEEIMRDKEQKGFVRVQAASILLDKAIDVHKFVVTNEHEDRLIALEEKIVKSV